MKNSQLLKFLFVGGCATLINYTVFVLLFRNGLHYLWSSTIGFFLGTVFAFTLNKKITFEDGNKFEWTKLLKYAGVNAVALAFGLFVLEALVRYGVNSYMANIIAIIHSTFINYIGIKKFVFLKDSK